MNYYALFLNENSFIEKCLLLMRFISNPQSQSFPHITVRLFKMSDSRIKELKSRTFTHLNIIEPGTFNIEKNKAPYVVFLRCESEELEGIEYKPDFPYSRLHITVYEGDDYLYALKLYELLEKYSWHFKLLFDKPRQLTERELGSKPHLKIDYEIVYKEILGEGYQELLNNKKDIAFKLNLIEKLLYKLNRYLQKTKVESIDSIYERQPKFNVYERTGDIFGQYQFDFNASSINELFMIEKPVRDAIHITPPEYARDMAKCGLEAFGNDERGIDFGDSSTGNGNLFLSLKFWMDEVNKEKGKEYAFRSAIGIDIDKSMADEAYVRCSKRGLTVIHGDALSPGLQLEPKRNLMLVNPPFNRHEEIPNDYKTEIFQFAKEQTGISIPGNAGLYVYHVLIMDRWLCDGGVAVWLLPTIFMQSKYGEALRNYLLNNVQLIRIHVYDEEIEQFENIQVSTSIVVFKKSKDIVQNEVLFSSGESVDQPAKFRLVNREQLIRALDNWRVLFNENVISEVNKNPITFGDLFEVKRGLATGANSFFVMTRERAKQYNIPDIALRPLIPKSRYLKSLVIDAKEDGYPDVEPQLVLIDCDLDERTIRTQYPDFYDYLQLAKVKGEDGKAVIDRVLVRNRKPWYKQESRKPPAFLLTYMGRNKSDLPALYFIWNKSKGTALNTYLLLYPKKILSDKLGEDPKIYENVLKALNQSADKIISIQTRIYSGGLKKIEPRELCKLPVLGFESILGEL